MKQKLMAITTATVLVFGLSACGGGTSKAQTVEQACQIVGESLNNVESQSGDVSGQDQDDEATFNAMITSLKNAADEVTNPEVKAAVEKTVTSITNLKEVGDTDDTDKLNDVVGEASKALEHLGELCQDTIEEN